MVRQHVGHSIWYFPSCVTPCCKILAQMAFNLPDLTKFPDGSVQPVVEVPSEFAPADIGLPIFVASDAKYSNLACAEALYCADTSDYTVQEEGSMFCHGSKVGL